MDHEAWALINYAVYVVSQIDKPRSIQLLKEGAIKAVNSDLRALVLSDYALLLASNGGIDEAIQVAEGVFAERLQSQDATCLARAYVDLGELYQVAGRTSAARPLIIEGIRRLREAGIQNMLLYQLIYLAEISLEEETVDWPCVGKILEEAHGIANRIGAKRQLLTVARLRLVFTSRLGDRRSFISAIEETFQLTQVSQSVSERYQSLRVLTSELERHGKLDYANALHCALGDSDPGESHPGWKALMSTDSHVTLCVLAVVLAKEAFDA